MHLREIQYSDLPLIYQWRNEESIRSWMYNSEIISYESHMSWYNNILKDENKHCFIFEFEKEDQGIINFSRLYNVLEWGFYLKPSSVKGLGRHLAELGLNIAFNNLNANKVYGQVLSFNEKSIKFHQKLGFSQEGVLKKHFKDSRGEFDIFQFGLLKSEWLER